MRPLLVLASLALVAVGSLRAQISLTTSTYSENFDTNTITGTFSATVGVHTDIGTTRWVGTKVGGTGTGTTTVNVTNGTATGGGIHSYGATGSTERALGLLASGTNIMGVGFKLTNNTGQTIQDLTVSFTQENWRSSTTATNTITAEFATNANAADATFLTAGTFTAATGLNLVGPAPVTTNSNLDGNDPANQVARTQTLSGINLANGEVIYFRWTDTNDAGNDAGLAIDNFSVVVVFSAVPEPGTILALSAVGFAGLTALRRKRKMVD